MIVMMISVIIIIIFLQQHSTSYSISEAMFLLTQYHTGTSPPGVSGRVQQPLFRLIPARVEQPLIRQTHSYHFGHSLVSWDFKIDHMVPTLEALHWFPQPPRWSVVKKKIWGREEGGMPLVPYALPYGLPFPIPHTYPCSRRRWDEKP